LKKRTLNLLEALVVRLVLHLLKVSGGFAGYLITHLIEHAFDKIVLPLAVEAFERGKLYMDMKDGKVKAFHLAEARRLNDPEKYNKALSDIFGPE